ncbi:MAG: carboxypeptidase-like regulatory domain-containing protein, partial [Gemmatimonadota bacterium]|nr:carboxypeptidase-like regulatory domain-containing protein [Gemmatimonadota bacterium]
MGKTFLIRVADPRGLTFAIVAQCFIAGSAAAQLDGVVTRAGGSPIEGVSIEAWSVDRRIAATITNALGVFTFSEEMVTGAVLLRVTALGYDVTEVEVRDGVTSYEIELTEEPLAVEGL